jgi:L-seryl-tRNA(Ser) seleniumtransferase
VNEILRGLPSVDEVLARPEVAKLVGELGRALVKSAARTAIEEARARRKAGTIDAAVTDARVLDLARKESEPRLRRVINATGVVLHTNLGRAPLHPEAVARVAEVAAGYSNLEIDLATGKRGHRSALVEPLLCELFAAPAAHVVNNCAGATLLALATLGSGKSAVVSRGELVEIGGAFRVPDIMTQSGCRLIEVGTTNRTRVSDYAAGLQPDSLVLRVHRSNFALVGFTETPAIGELAELAHDHGTVLLHDLGSGALDPALDEMTAAQSLRAGADLVLISGDKLLGGPQAGLLLGRRDLVDACKRHPLSRALRADRMLLAALEATLRLYREGRGGELPALRALRATEEELRQRATRLALELQQRGISCSVVETQGRPGGGSLPLRELPGSGVRILGQGAALLAALRDESVIALLRDGEVTLDVRCVSETGDLALAVSRAVQAAGARAGEAESATLEAGEAEV